MAPGSASDTATSFIRKYSPRFKEMHGEIIEIDCSDIIGMGDLLMLVLQHFNILLVEAAKRGGITKKDVEEFPDGILTVAEFTELTARIPQNPDMIKIGTDMISLREKTENLYENLISGYPCQDVEEFQEAYEIWYSGILEYYDIDRLRIPRFEGYDR
ncbi:MAG: hypothetical protein M1840_009133 [Geoglossum simile]|nr:MAG: hypothetical protein M1840_009133 [Geoglossum simile]